MLKSLYDYAIRNGLILPTGYKNKTVKAHIALSSKNEDFAAVIVSDGKEFPAPDIGSIAKGTDKSNVLLEKRSIVFPDEPSAKSAFFLAAMKDAAQWEPLLLPCIQAIEDPDVSAKIRAMLDREKIKPGDRVTFQVDHKNILKSEAIMRWWADYRKQFLTTNENNQVRCLITGDLCVPVRTADPVTGLRSVGGHSSGDTIVCFDKAAFESYDLKQAANAPVSEEAMSAVNLALTELLKKAPTLTGMKIVHWYDCDVAPKEDPLPLLFSGFTFQEDDDEDEEEDDPEDAEDRKAEKAQAAEQQFRALVEAVESGKSVTPLNAQYHILMLSGASGRVMIRRYERGTYGELVEALNQWENELRLTNSNETDALPPCKLKARFIRLLKYQKADRKVFQRMDKELSAFGPAVLQAIINRNAPLPDSVAVRALNHIRSKMMASEEDDQRRDSLDPIAEQWLKAWLLRNRNKGGMILDKYNPEYYDVPYCCGAMVAVYGAIQLAAMEDVNTSVIDRYYGSAIQMPGMVVGAFSRQASYHLSKLNPYEKEKYVRILAELKAKIIGNHIPTTLNLEQQSEFSLGYYQMIAHLNKEKWAARDAKKQAAEQTKEEKKDGHSESV